MKKILIVLFIIMLSGKTFSQLYIQMYSTSLILCASNNNGVELQLNDFFGNHIPGTWLVGNCNGPVESNIFYHSSYGHVTLYPTVTTTYYAVSNSCLNPCTCNHATITVVVSQQPSSPGSIIGDTSVCQGQNSVTYSVPTITNASSYVWTLPNGSTGSSTTNSITVNYGTSAISGNITVKGINTPCIGAISSLPISVKPLPAGAGTISGLTSVCRGQNSVTYSIPPISNATSYIWTLPNGATGTSSTNSITINFNTSALTSNISVKGVNSCGEGTSSSKTITVNRFPQSAGTISGSSLVCQGQTAITYTVPSIGHATSYIWTLPNGATGTSSSNSITVSYGNTAVSGNISVYGNNSCGVGSSSITPITVNPLPSSAGIISGDSIVCQGENSITYSVPTINNANSYVWTLPSGATGTSSTNNITTNYGTSSISGNITVKGNNVCGFGSQASKSITVNPLPSNAGTISGPSVVCKGQNTVTYTVPVISNATSYIWTLPNGVTGTSSTRSITVNYDTSAVSGVIEVYGQNSCGNGNASIIAITVNAFPSSASLISGPVEVCQGQSSLTYSAPTIANANSYIWTLPSGVTGTSTNNSISVNFSTSALSGNIEVFGQNACGVGNTSIKYITVNPLPSNSTAISGSSIVCQGQSSVIYAVPSIANASSYIWTLPSGATGTSSSNSITINYGATSVSSIISVKGNNDCGFGISSSKSIVVNPLPSNAGTISGSSVVCQGQNAVTYSVPSITNATSYVWTLPNGITGSSSTNTITVNYSTTAISGMISVKGSNSCGFGSESSKSITVNPLPENAGVISGFSLVCQGQNSVTYVVPTIENATSYIWSLPSGTSGSSSTNSITVNFGISAVSGNISVKGSNSCGIGAISITPIIVNPLPSNAGTISGLSVVCQGQNSVTYTVPTITNATSYVWTLPNGVSGTSSTNSITLNFATSVVSGNISVKGSNDCGFGTSSSKSLTVNQLPSNAGTISGASSVCQGQNAITYSVPNITNATSYVWTLPNGVSGSSSTNSITVNFATSAVSGIISVKGSNSCGFGSESSKSITVNPLPSNAGTISGSSVVCQGQSFVTFTVPIIENATSYVWVLPSGTSGSSSTNSITANFGNSAVSGNISVKGSNSCGIGANSVIPITVNPLPSNAGTIFGPSAVCKGQNSVTYSIPAITNANSYVWTLPSGVFGTSSTNSITVNYSSSAISGSIEVYGQNSCGNGNSSIIPIIVNDVPSNAGTISGSTVVCQGQDSVVYAIPSIANATSYVWTIPSGVNGTSTNSSISVSYGTSANSGNIEVYGQNSCGVGNPSIILITVNPLPSEAGLISGSSVVCQGQNAVTYSTPFIANATSYYWVLPNGSTGTSTSNNIMVNYGLNAVSSNISVKGYNNCGFGSISIKPIAVNLLPSNAGTISGSSVVCQGQNFVTYTIPSIPNATSYEWTLPNDVTGNSSSNSITVNYGTTSVSGTISVKGINNCGYGSTSSKQIIVNPLPSNSGIISGPTSVCRGQMAQNYSVFPIENATSYFWTLPNGATGTSTSNNINVNYGSSAISGNLQVYGQNSCGNGNSSIIVVSVNSIPTNAETISGSSVVCQGESSVLYSVPTISNATSYVWLLPNGAQGISSTNNIYVSYNLSSVTGSIAVYGQNYCGNGSSSMKTITVNPLPSNAEAISGSDFVCQGQNAVLYSIPSISNANSYIWTLPSGATGSSSSNSITVNYSNNSISGNLSVYGSNNCGNGIISSKSITVNPLPSNAGEISGLASVCSGQNSVTYSVTSIPNASSYVWTLPSGVIGSSNTNSITVNYSSSAVSGDIEVFGVNNCGVGNSSTIAITVNPLPSNAGTISGSTVVCQGVNDIVYAVPTISNANSYVWTLPLGAQGSSTTNTILVSFDTSAVSGGIEVFGQNSCGDGNSSILAINVNTMPPKPTILLSSNILHSNALIGNQWYNQNGLIQGAINQDYAYTANGSYYVIVTINDCNSEPSNTISIGNVSILNFEENENCFIYPNPFSNSLNIESKINTPIDIELVNSIGQLIYKENNIIQTTIQTQSIAPGLYFVKIKNSEGFDKIFKVIKN